MILEWVNHVDLFRIKGVGEEYSDLLEEAGVDTVVELAQRKADNLYAEDPGNQCQEEIGPPAPIQKDGQRLGRPG